MNSQGENMGSNPVGTIIFFVSMGNLWVTERRPPSILSTDRDPMSQGILSIWDYPGED